MSRRVSRGYPARESLNDPRTQRAELSRAKRTPPLDARIVDARLLSLSSQRLAEFLARRHAAETAVSSP